MNLLVDIVAPCSRSFFGIFFLYFQIHNVDEVDSNLVASNLDFIFKKSYALNMVSQMKNLIVRHCLGCQYHGSHFAHICLYESVAKDASKYWEETSSTLDQTTVLFEFLTRADVESLPVDDYMTMDALKKADGEWKEDIMAIANIIARRREL